MWWLDDGSIAERRTHAEHASPLEQEPQVNCCAIQLLAEITGCPMAGGSVDAAQPADEPACPTSPPAPADEVTELLQKLDAQTARLSVAEAQLSEAGLQHAEQLAALQLQFRALEESAAKGQATYDELAATIEEREADWAEQLAKLRQAWLDRETALQESDSRRAAEALAWRSELQTRQQTLAESEAAREALQSAIDQRDATHAAQLVASEQARESAVVLAYELAAQLMARTNDAVTLQSRLEKESAKLKAADGELERCRTVHADELIGLHAQILSLQQAVDAHEAARRESDAAAAQREAGCSLALLEAEQAHNAAQQRVGQLVAELAAMDNQRARMQATLETEIHEHSIAADSWRESERQHICQTESLQSKLLTLEQLVQEHEAARHESSSELARSKEQHAAELAQLDEARQAAGQLNEQLETQLRSLREQLASSSTRADKESASRAAIESELQRLTEEFRQRSDEAERLRSQFQALQCHSTEQYQELARSSARLRQEWDDCERELRDRDEQMKCQATELARRREGERRLQLEKQQLAAQHAEYTAAAEAQAAEHRAEVEVERASRMRIEHELQQRDEELARMMSDEGHLQQQLHEVIQCCKDEHGARHQAEALADSLTQEVAQLRKSVDAFRGLAQRQVAARKKLEAAIKRSDESVDSAASSLMIRANIEVNERIRRLTTELTATRNQELSVRQMALREIKRARDEVQRLRDRLAKEEKAA